MNILVLNCGSSSCKYQLINTDGEKTLAKGNCDRIGMPGSFIKHNVNGEKTVINVDMPTHADAIEQLIKILTDDKLGVIKSLNDIGAVGHRVVHGGEHFSHSVVIDDEVLGLIEDCVPLAPLHNPANITGIKACMKEMPGVPQVAVFDTAFHQTMPKEAYLYAIPKEYYEKYGVRKYGFHGTSHKFVAEKCAELLGKPIEETKIVTCHLGNGSSVTAVCGGKSVDTSMGFTPLDGVLMGTRCGILDPAVVLFLMEKLNVDTKEMNTILNKKSGVGGLTGISPDMRDICDAMYEGNEVAKMAIDIYGRRVKGYIGQYMAIMNGLDAVVFAGGVGENDFDTRLACLTDLENIGIKIDTDKNYRKSGIYEISTPDSKVKVFVIATDEELAIARETLALVK